MPVSLPESENKNWSGLCMLGTIPLKTAARTLQEDCSVCCVLLSVRNHYSHGKCGLLSPWKASCDRITLPSLLIKILTVVECPQNLPGGYFF